MVLRTSGIHFSSSWRPKIYQNTLKMMIFGGIPQPTPPHRGGLALGPNHGRDVRPHKSTHECSKSWVDGRPPKSQKLKIYKLGPYATYRAHSLLYSYLFYMPNSMEIRLKSIYIDFQRFRGGLQKCVKTHGFWHIVAKCLFFHRQNGRPGFHGTYVPPIPLTIPPWRHFSAFLGAS